MANPICHWELMVSDPDKARAFYRQVFDWKLEDQPGGEYTLIGTGSEPGGGMMRKTPAAPAPALNVYFRVDSIDGTLRKVVEAGGTVVVPKTEIPGHGRFAMFLDPDQIAVGIFDPKP
jgi:predicted enzyme related to lactoylglutathione lyase